MLGNLFKPRWQHRDPAVRARAAAQLDPSSDSDTLARLACEDSDPGVRTAAVTGLLDLAMLDDRIQNDTDTRVREAASERFMALLAGTVDGAPAVPERLRLIRHTDNPRVLRHIAQHSPDDESRQAAMAAIADPETLFELAVSGRDEGVRLAAAERVEDTALLRRLGREGRDKRVVRHARERVKEHQRDEAREQDRQTRLEQVLDALLHLARTTTDPLFDARLQQLEQRWSELVEGADPSQRERAEQALQVCHAYQYEQQEAVQREQRRQAAEQESLAALDTLETLLRDSDEDTWERQLGALRSVVDTQQRRWQAAAEERAAAPEVQQRFERVLEHWRQLIALAEAAQEAHDPAQRLELAHRWPVNQPAPKALREAREAADQAADDARRAAASSQATAAGGGDKKHRESPHRGLVVALRRELQRGNLKHANRLWHKAEGLLGEEHDGWLVRQLERLRKRRDELRDWHSFAAQPKKEQLCERMEALIGVTLDASELATAIQALHDEWRALMSSDQDQDQALWDRFKNASDRAYEPCQAYFAELDAQRQANLEKRRALCDQLADFVDGQDWARADFQAVWEIRRQAPREWRGYAPVRFTEGRDLHKRFSALLTRIDEQLDQAWQVAETERQRLIDQARELAEHDDVHSAAREARHLQHHWRAAPWLPPARHRRFQKAFRRIMDALFAARDAANQVRQAERQENIDQARTRLDEAQRLLGENIGDQDPAMVSALAAELERMTPMLDREDQKRASRLRERLRRLRADLPRWQHWHQSLERLAATPAGDGNDEDTTLTVALEVLAGVDSPEADRAARMAWQLEQLPRMMKTADFEPLDEALALLEGRDAQAPLAASLRERMAGALRALAPKG